MWATPFQKVHQQQKLKAKVPSSLLLHGNEIWATFQSGWPIKEIIVTACEDLSKLATDWKINRENPSDNLELEEKEPIMFNGPNGEIDSLCTPRLSDCEVLFICFEYYIMFLSTPAYFSSRILSTLWKMGCSLNKLFCCCCQCCVTLIQHIHKAGKHTPLSLSLPPLQRLSIQPCDQLRDVTLAIWQ